MEEQLTQRPVACKREIGMRFPSLTNADTAARCGRVYIATTGEESSNGCVIVPGCFIPIAEQTYNVPHCGVIRNHGLRCVYPNIDETDQV